MSVQPAIAIPVLPYVKKILLKLYGNEPLLLVDKTLLAKSAVGISMYIPEDTRVPGCTVRVQMSNRVLEYYADFKHAFQLGMYFERVAQQMMLTHIAAQKRMHRDSMSALRDFYEMYELTDDDYDIESAYRMWQENKRKYLPKHLAPIC